MDNGENAEFQLQRIYLIKFHINFKCFMRTSNTYQVKGVAEFSHSEVKASKLSCLFKCRVERCNCLRSDLCQILIKD